MCDKFIRRRNLSAVQYLTGATVTVEMYVNNIIQYVTEAIFNAENYVNVKYTTLCNWSVVAVETYVNVK